MHTSIMLQSPIEFIDVTPVNPLISKCQIKVCYVGERPNRNGSIITKEVAREMANSLPGSPIVGFYNETKEDFEEHNRIIDISNGRFEIKDITRPYGFVDLNAKVWFAKYLDDNQVEREYLVTEGWLWTGQYPECAVLLQGAGKSQSMELDENTLDGSWSEDSNGFYEFFIINEAIISKLCILGDDVEPCFEGASIAAPQVQFSFGDDFKQQLFSMMNELKEYLLKGGEKVFVRYNVSVGDALWTSLYNYVKATYPDNTGENYSIYSIDGVYEEEGQTFAVLQQRVDNKYYRLNFEFVNNELAPNDTLVEITSTYTPDAENPQFSLEEIENFENSLETLDSSNTEEIDNSEETSEEENMEEEEESHGDPAPQYNLDEIPEYIEARDALEAMTTQFNELTEKYNELVAQTETLQASLNSLSQFKAQIERKEKEDMIAKFYMLSDEDKKDVVDNIDTYSLDDIEAKLSVICVRNKVSFDAEKDNKTPPTTFNLDSAEENGDNTMPAWVKRVMSVAKTL